jgi:Holliday junction resolvasome RuvABC ATP-dependent DNA helicase subunit
MAIVFQPRSSQSGASQPPASQPNGQTVWNTPSEPETSDTYDPFDRIIGQRRAVPFLREIRDGICLGAHPHPLLFLGRSGHGKTSLSKAFADSIGAEFVRIDCGPELRSEHLVEKLLELKSFSVVFVDEFQAMRKRVQEILYGAIDSQLVPKLDRRRLDRCAPPVPITPFVLIGATNEPGRLLPAMRARMVNVVMEEYSEEDLRAIVAQKAQRFMLRLTDAAVDRIVRASGGSPRNIVQILQSVECTSASWRFGYEMGEGLGSGSGDEPASLLGDDLSEHVAPASVTSSHSSPPSAAYGAPEDVIEELAEELTSQLAARHRPYIPDELIERALTWMGLDKAGLDATGRTVLSTIGQHGRATAELVATVLGLDIAFARQRLAELRARHLVVAAPGRGWTLTDLGIELAAELNLQGQDPESHAAQSHSSRIPNPRKHDGRRRPPQPGATQPRA